MWHIETWIVTCALYLISSWREVVDPETRKVMFVNIETGECAWKLPEGETS